VSRRRSKVTGLPRLSSFPDNILLNRRVESSRSPSVAAVLPIVRSIDVIDNGKEVSRPTSRPQIAQKQTVQALDDLFAELDVVDLNDLLNDLRTREPC